MSPSRRPAAIAVVFFFFLALAPIAVANTTPHVLSGGNFSQNWSTTTQITANDDWSGVPSIVGYLGDDGSTTTTGLDPQLRVTPFATVDVIAQTNPGNTAGGVGEMDALANPVVALQGSGTADFPNLILYLDTTGRTNIVVSYNVRDIDATTDNAAQQVALQYRVGGSGNYTNLPLGYIADATTGPSLATLVTPISVTLPAAADNQALVEVRILTSNAASNDEWVGIDDITVTSDPAAPPLPTLNISSESALEGAGSGTQTYTFEITLDAPAPPGGVSFTLQTQDNTATDADNDYDPAGPTAGSIPATQTGPFTFDVTVNADDNPEPTEQFFVNVTGITGANPGVVQGVGTITSDDAPPGLTIDNVAQAETNGATTTFTFTVNLDAPAPPLGVVFDVATAADTATAGTDYVHKQELARTIPAGQTSAQFTVTVNGDTVFENNETFFVNVTNVTGANVVDGQGLGTINNDDTQPSLAIADVAQLEGDSGTTTMTFNVTLTGATELPVSVNWATADGVATSGGADYVNDSNTLNFTPGDTSEPIVITINGDTSAEGDEHFLVNLSGATGASISDSSAFGVIRNDEPISIGAVDTPVLENFDNLTTPGSPSTVPGWTFVESGSAANLTYTSGTGSGTAGDTYNFGAAASPERAFGSLQSGSLIPTLGAFYRNDTGATITSLTIQYTGEEWRLGSASRADRLDFQYSLDATSLTTGTWTDVDAGDFTTPNQTGTGAKDGNAVANRFTHAFQIDSLSIAPGAVFWIRFADFNASGADDGLAVDDFRLIANFTGALLSIDDITQLETNGATLFTFTVSLTAPAPAGLTFDIATQDGTATTADNDYALLNLPGQSVPMGNTSAQFSVTVNGDPTAEPTESFFINVTNIANALPSDPQGIGTIVDDDSPITPIHDIQGNGAASPMAGNPVTVRGIVTGVKSNGFFVQEEDAEVDADPATSEGVFVFTSSAPSPAAAFGALVQVSGTVSEFIPASDPMQPPVTELVSPTVVQIASGQPLPVPMPLSATFPDPAGMFDQLERVEGMRVRVNSLTVTGPTDGSVDEQNATGTTNGRFYGIVTGVPRPFREPGIQAPDAVPSGSIPPIPRWDFNPERLKVESTTLGQPILTLKAGDVVGPFTGPLDYGFRAYAIYIDSTETPVVTPGTLATVVTAPLSNEVTVASFNMQRFFDDVNDNDGDPVPPPTTTAYNNRLSKASIAIRQHLLSPDIIGVQEAENLRVLQDLAAQIVADGGPAYDVYLDEGNDVGGIDVGFMVKVEEVSAGLPRVSNVTVTQEGLNFTWTDPKTGNPALLHDRPSLVLEGSVNRAPGVSFDLTVINNHLRSLNGIEDETVDGLTTVGDRVRRKRQAQAEWLADLVQQRQTADPAENIILVGDFNAFEVNDGYAATIQTILGTPVPDNETVVPGDGVDLVNPDLADLVDTPPPAERYSYVHEGNAQNLDHAIVNQALIAATSARRIEHPRIDSDYPETERNTSSDALRFSDHDPIVTYLAVPAFVVTDFAIDLQHSGYATAAGQTTITVVVTNNGPDSGDASFTFPLPADMAFVSDSEPAGWTCTTPGLNATGTIDCSTSTPMAPGTATFTFLVGVGDLPANTPLNMSATVDAVSSDPDGSNDTDNLTVTVLQSSQYYATKSVSGSFAPGSNVTYSIQIVNDKPFAQPDNTGDELFDDIPSDLTVVSAVATSGTALTTGLGDVTWNGAIPSGQSVTITIVATIGPSATGTISNQASVNDDFDNTGDNERATLTDDPNQPGAADPTSFTVVASDTLFTATKTITNGSFVPGSQVTWEVVLTNNTGHAITDNPGNEFVDTMPAGLTLDFASSDVGILGNPSLNVLTWDGALASGQSAHLTIKATIGPSVTVGTVLSNQATIAFDSEGDGTNEQSDVTDDPTTVADDDPTSFTVVSPAGLFTATKSVSGTFVPGSNVTYTVTLTNHTGFTQNDNTIGANPNEFTDILPASLALLSANATSGTAVANTGTNTVTWNGSIADEASVTITIVATINPSATGTISNQGTAAYDSEGNNRNDQTLLTDDPLTVAVDDQTTFIVGSSSALFFATKAISGQNSFVPGSQVTWTVVLTNNTGLAQADNPGNEFVDTMPPGMTLDFASASPGVLGNPSLNVLTWDGALADGQSANITIKATIDPSSVPGTVLSNQANIAFDADANGTNDQTAVTDDPNTVTANDPTSFTVVSADGLFSATKTVSGSFVTGTNVTYTVTLTNHTGFMQNDVTIGANTDEFTDVLPSSLTLVSANASSGTAVANTGTNTVTWNGSIADEASVTITIVATINANAAGLITNQGTVHYDSEGNNRNDQTLLTDDPTPAGAADPTTFVAAQANDVTATKSVSGSFVQGTDVTYTIVLTNNMAVTQPDNFQHEFTDILPAGLTYVSSTATSGTTGFCCSDTFFWDGSIPAGGTVTITITATISPTATGTISNQGQTIFDTNGDASNDDSHLTDDPSTAAVDDPTSFTVLQANEVTATKSVSGTFVQGTDVTYTIVLTNNMGVTQPDNFQHEFTDILPADLTYVSSTATSGTTGFCCGNTFFWDGSIPAGGTVTITVTATISPTATGTISNQGQTIFDRDSDNSNESSHLTDDPSTAAADDATVFAVIALNTYTASKSVSGTFVSGTNVTYTVTLANGFAFALGDDTGDEFTDVLPASLTLVSANASSGTAVANTGTNTVTWNGSIAPSASVTITITATIDPSASGTVSNQGTTAYDLDDNGSNEASGVTDDPSTGAAGDATVFTIVDPDSFAATKSVSGTFVSGSNVTYTITLTNGFAFTLGDNTGDELTDVLPASLTLLSANASSGTAVANTVTNTVTWNGSIASASSVTITVTATIDPSASGTISNQATTAFDGDDNGSNESAGVTDDPSTVTLDDATAFVVNAAAGLFTATKSAAGTFVAGTNVTYTVTLTNDIGLAQSDNPGDEFTDVLPASLTLVSANASSGSAVANTGTNTVTWNGAIASGASVTITIVATINPSATGAIANQGTFAYDADGNGTNEQSGVTDDPSTGAADDATSFAVVLANSFSATKSVAGELVPGGAVTYTVVLTNGYAHPLADNPGDEFTDVLPAAITLASANATSGTAVANSGTNTVTWNGSIPSGGSVTITINGTINANAATGPVSNQGTAVVDQDDNGTNEASFVTDDPNAAGSQATTFQLNAASDVTASKTVATSGVVGSSVTYTIVITNNLPHTLTDNAGDEFLDVLPSELDLVSAEATSGTALATVATNTVTWNGSIPSGGSVTITIEAIVRVAASTISNQGEVRIDLDDDGDNETTILTQGPGGGPTSFAGAAAVNGIPALSPMMLLMLAAMIAAAAMLKMRS